MSCASFDFIIKFLALSGSIPLSTKSLNVSISSCQKSAVAVGIKLNPLF